jgi:hypothetical protein
VVSQFVFFYKDIYTEEVLKKTGLNERQIKTVIFVKEKGKITNKEYQKITGVSKPTASRELATLVSRKLLEQQGVTGKGPFYILIKSSQTAQENKGDEEDMETRYLLTAQSNKKGQEKSPNPLIFMVSRAGFEPATR